MKGFRRFALVATLILSLLLSACSASDPPDETAAPSEASQQIDVVEPVAESSEEEKPDAGQIYLYGEEHAVEVILEKELELWLDYYQGQNMRHMFIEMPYYTAEYFNLWMQSEGDEILDAVFDEMAGTSASDPLVKAFYQWIKANCPDTIFHGTDVGHQSETIGARYLQYLEDNGMADSEAYLLTLEAIEQGETYYNDYVDYDHVYRENKMAENFIREYEALGGESIMGIYGGAHTGLDDMDYETATVPCMANQLTERYGDIIHSVNLRYLMMDTSALLTEPIHTDTITVGGKEYVASYFGEQDLTGMRDYALREFWRLEDAYDDFKDLPRTGDALPYDNYPMQLEAGQVFVIDYTMTDESTTRTYYRSDGNEYDGRPTTEEFTVE